MQKSTGINRDGAIFRQSAAASSESDIQNQIRVALSPQGIVFRTNAGDFWQGDRIYYPPLHQDILIHLRRVQGLPQGFPDLLFCGFDGQAGFIEVKRPHGVVRDAQRNFIALMHGYGYPAGIARSPAEAMAIIGASSPQSPAKNV